MKYVYNDIFKFTQPAAISKMKSWQDVGVVDKIGVIQGKLKGARSSNHYGLTNPLVLKHMFPDINIFELYERKMRVCLELDSCYCGTGTCTRNRPATPVRKKSDKRS